MRRSRTILSLPTLQLVPAGRKRDGIPTWFYDISIDIRGLFAEISTSSTHGVENARHHKKDYHNKRYAAQRPVSGLFCRRLEESRR